MAVPLNVLVPREVLGQYRTKEIDSIHLVKIKFMSYDMTYKSLGRQSESVGTIAIFSSDV